MRDSDIVTRTSLAKESKKLDVASEDKNTTCMGSCVVLCQVMKEARWPGGVFTSVVERSSI